MRDYRIDNGRQRLVSWVATLDTADLPTLAGHIEAGEVTPVTDRTYTLAETPAAIRYHEEGQAPAQGRHQRVNQARFSTKNSRRDWGAVP